MSRIVGAMSGFRRRAFLVLSALILVTLVIMISLWRQFFIAPLKLPGSESPRVIYEQLSQLQRGDFPRVLRKSIVEELGASASDLLTKSSMPKAALYLPSKTDAYPIYDSTPSTMAFVLAEESTFPEFEKASKLSLHLEASDRAVRDQLIQFFSEQDMGAHLLLQVGCCDFLDYSLITAEQATTCTELLIIELGEGQLFYGKLNALPSAEQFERRFLA
ncbi:MAG: hypothetical protein Q4P72_01770 [Eubacteriales bacterium]|nr:hypothetical protein [Eubacteriales bacterium]